MHEIARLAGVSQSTVSRVLNGTTPVGSEKYATVMEVVERLKFSPNAAAQGLVSGKTSTIGILTRHLGSPYFGECLRGMTVGMQGSSYYPMIALGGNQVDDHNAVELLLARGVDALILHLAKHLDGDFVREIAQHRPVIVIGQQIRGFEEHCLAVNDRQGGYLATMHLIDRGHVAIAHISGPEGREDAADRQAGYWQALLDHALEADPELTVEGDFLESAGFTAMDRLLAKREQHPFSAVFAASDQIALGARLLLYYHGILVPQDISLVGFDDLPSAQYMIPPLTTIRQPAYDMGHRASRAAQAALAGEKVNLTEVPLELIERQSVADR